MQSAGQSNRFHIDPRDDPRDPLSACLLALMQEKAKGNPWCDARTIARLLAQDYGINLDGRKIFRILTRAAHSGLVSRRRRHDGSVFAIAPAGEDLLGTLPIVRLVDPQKPALQVFQLHRLLRNLKGIVRVCDPYVDGHTIEHLAACENAAEVRLLTRNIKNQLSLKSLVRALQAQGTRRIVVAVTTLHLHDRFVIDDTQMILFGTSLNSFAKNYSFTVLVGPDVRKAMLDHFDYWWQQASPL